MSRTSPFYRYDPHLGNPRDTYTRADIVHPEARQPEIPGRFVATVEGETIINTMHGRQTVAWRTEAGTPCIILGYWADGTIHLQWAAISGHYRIDGRFPAWVAELDPSAEMAGGGRILPANNPAVRRRGLRSRAVLLTLALLALLVLILFLLARQPTI